MDARAIGLMLGKQAADAGYAERMARVRALSSVSPALQISQAAAEGAGQGFGNVANTYSFGLTDRLGLTHTKDYVNDAVNKWSKGLALGSALAVPVGGLARGGGKVLQALSRVAGVRKAVPVAGEVARFASYNMFPRPVGMTSMLLRTPAMLGKHVVAPAVRGTGRLVGRVPGVRGAIARIAATRGGQAISRGGRIANVVGRNFMRTRPMKALSGTAKFVEGRGGVGSKMFAAADMGVPMYAGIRYFDPESEAMARALGYDSQYVVDVSPTPGLYVPEARIQPPLFNTVPGLVNERRMRDWLAQNRDAMIQAQTDARTAETQAALDRRY